MTRFAIPFFAVLVLLAAGPAAAARAPADPVIQLIRQARAAQAKGNTELALRLAQSAIVADPARPDAYVALGDVYALTGQSEFAHSYYEAALSIDPMAPAALKAEAALQAKAKPPVLAAP